VQGEWLRYHTRAIDQAVRAGLQSDQSSFEQALVIEAFGQHFLSDAFSAGHIRVPRQEIVEFYTRLGTAAFAHLQRFIEDRMVAGLWAQLMAACPAGPWFEDKVREKIRATVHARVTAEMGTRFPSAADFGTLFGTYVGGLISMILHDRDSARGVAVASAAQSGGWRALGDEHLAQEPLTIDQAQQAILAATRDVEQAYEFGLHEGNLTSRSREPKLLPSLILFDFDRDSLRPDARNALTRIARFMTLEPAARVMLRGHSDPIGTPDNNMNLGLRRADLFLRAQEVNAEQLATQSAGETQLAERDPRRYSRNRRVEFVFTSGPPPASASTSRDPGAERAYEKCGALGPPFKAEQFIPYLDPAAREAPLPEWRWGALDPEMRDAVADRVRSMLDTHGEILRAQVTGLANITESVPNCGTVTFRPREVGLDLINELRADPLEFLEEAVGR